MPVLVALSLVVGTAPGAKGATVTVVQKASDSKSPFDNADYKGETAAIDEPLPDLEIYRVCEKAATGLSSVLGVRDEVQEIAGKFCRRRNAMARSILERHSSPPQVLGNFPRVELLFQCVPDAPDAAPSVSPAQVPSNRYERLAALKKLLDSGALTPPEFEAEKEKILATPLLEVP